MSIAASKLQPLHASRGFVARMLRTAVVVQSLEELVDLWARGVETEALHLVGKLGRGEAVCLNRGDVAWLETDAGYRSCIGEGWTRDMVGGEERWDER